MSNELMHEIEESLRQERLAAWWKEYGPYLLAGCVLAVLFTAASSVWRSHQASVDGRQTAIITDDGAAPDPAAALRQAAPVLTPPLRAMALLNAGGLLGEKGDLKGAAAAFAQGAVDKALPEPFHGYAVLQAARFAEAAGGADGKALLASLQPLTTDAKSPWAGEARLEGAVIADHLLHDPKQARALLAPLLTPAVAGGPDNAALTGRAKALDHVYASENGAS